MKKKEVGRCAAPARVRRHEHFCAAKISAKGGFTPPGAFLMTGLPQKQRFCGTRFRFPPSLKNPFPLKRPRPRGLRAPHLGSNPRGVGRGCKFLMFSARPRPAAAEREVGGIQVCTKLAHACHIAQDHLVGARVHLSLHPKPSSSPTPCTALLFFSAWRRRGGGCNTDKVPNLRPASE